MSITPRRTTPTFNPSLFKSPLFTIALADPFDALRVKVFADYGAPVPDRVNFSSVEDNDENMPDRATLDDSDECLPDQAIPNDSDDLPARAMSEYFVHQIIISVSEELEKHMNNEMKEGKERRMVLHEVDTDTFERFLQWAYTGEYSLT